MATPPRRDFRTGGGLRGALFDEMLGSGDDRGAPPLQPGQRLGSWELCELIGQGGSASVYLAKRTEAGVEQTAAIKVRPLRSDDGPDFTREIEVVAALNHPYIVSLIEAGATENELAWFAIAFVDGVPISEYIDEHRPEWRARVDYFDRLCSAVEHAHARGVVHRDIKPSNVYIDVHGLPKLLDFGIASSGAQAPDRRMTPAYASPEQRAGEPVTTRSDIWQLGLLLQEICRTGHAADSAEARALRAGSFVRDDLRRIVERATAQAPERRYPDVGALRADLARLRARRPLLGTEADRAYRAARFLERNAISAVVAAAGVLVLLVAMGVAAVRLAQQKNVAVANAQRATAMLQFLTGTLNQNDPFRGAGGSADAGTPLTLVGAMERVQRQLVADTQLTAGDRTALRATVGAILAANGAHARCIELLEDAAAVADANAARVSEQMQFHATSADCLYGLAKNDAARAATERVTALAARAAPGASDGGADVGVDERVGRAELVAGQLASAGGDFAAARAHFSAAAAVADRAHVFYVQFAAQRYLTEQAMNTADWPRAAASARRMLELGDAQKGRDSVEHIQAASLLVPILRRSGQREGLLELIADVEATIARVRAAGNEVPFYVQTDLDFAAAELLYDAARDAECTQRADAALAVLKQHDGLLVNRYNLLMTSGGCYLVLRDAAAAAQRADEATAIARERMAGNHLAVMNTLRLAALARLVGGDLAQARSALEQALAERAQVAGRPLFDIGLALTAAWLAQREGCTARMRAYAALAQLGVAVGTKDAATNRLLHFIRGELAAPPPTPASCPQRAGTVASGCVARRAPRCKTCDLQ